MFAERQFARTGGNFLVSIMRLAGKQPGSTDAAGANGVRTRTAERTRDIMRYSHTAFEHRPSTSVGGRYTVRCKLLAAPGKMTNFGYGRRQVTRSLAGETK